MNVKQSLLCVIIGRIAVSVACGQSAPQMEKTEPTKLDGREGRPLALENFRPVPMLRTPTTSLTRAKFPVVDVHTHFRFKLRSDEHFTEFLRIMDRNNIALCVSLDGGWGEKLQEHIAYLNRGAPGRFAVFGNIDWQGSGTTNDYATWDCQRPDFGRRITEQLRESHAAGAVGLKIFKNFGLEIKNPDGSLVRIDDPRWDPIWQTCAELQWPILIHTADPKAFFEPIDEKNERWEELHRHPDWSFHGGIFPSHEALVKQLIAVVERHPRTTFIAAHLLNLGEDLNTLGEYLDRHPNLYVDISSRINELGRQPRAATKFLNKYADRVIFGTDGPWPEARLNLYWRFLETSDEYFPYSEKEFPPQGLWNIYGVELSDAVLRKIYSENVLRLLPNVKFRDE